MRPDDQPRPDLDTAVDAVAAALTAVDDDAVTASLRRTRGALAEPHGRERPAFIFGWRATAAVAFTILLVAVVMWRLAETPTVEIASTPRAVAPTPVPSAAAQVARATPAPPVAPRPAGRVRATSVPTPAPVRRTDPLAALVAAVQAIPEDAWTRSAAAPEVTVAPIAIAPLETPAIPDAPAEPIAPGEP